MTGGSGLACAYMHTYELIGQAYHQLLLIVSDSLTFILIVVKIIQKYFIRNKGKMNNSTAKFWFLTEKKKTNAEAKVCRQRRPRIKIKSINLTC